MHKVFAVEVCGLAHGNAENSQGSRGIQCVNCLQSFQSVFILFKYFQCVSESKTS